MLTLLLVPPSVELAAGYAESTIADMDAPYPSTRPASLRSYDYESDSDLEDEEDEEASAIGDIVDGVEVGLAGLKANPTSSTADLLV